MISRAKPPGPTPFVLNNPYFPYSSSNRVFFTAKNTENTERQQTTEKEIYPMFCFLFNFECVIDPVHYRAIGTQFPVLRRIRNSVTFAFENKKKKGLKFNIFGCPSAAGRPLCRTIECDGIQVKLRPFRLLQTWKKPTFFFSSSAE